MKKYLAISAAFVAFSAQPLQITDLAHFDDVGLFSKADAGNGKAWAKWVFVILYVIGLIGFIMSISMMFMFGLITGLINIAQYAIGAYATFLLFQKDSQSFFA